MGSIIGVVWVILLRVLPYSEIKVQGFDSQSEQQLSEPSCIKLLHVKTFMGQKNLYLRYSIAYMEEAKHILRKNPFEGEQHKRKEGILQDKREIN